MTSPPKGLSSPAAVAGDTGGIGEPGGAADPVDGDIAQTHEPDVFAGLHGSDHGLDVRVDDVAPDRDVIRAGGLRLPGQDGAQRDAGEVLAGRLGESLDA